MPPLIVADSHAAAGAAVAELCREGWTRVELGALPLEPWDLASRRLLVTCSVEIRDERLEALFAALRGAAVVAVGSADVSELASFFDELSRLGRVDFARDGVAPTLTLEQRRLLELLAGGETLGEAARRLSLSRRTADRRLAEARNALGVASTAQAVLAFRAGEQTRRGPGLARP